MFSKLRRIIRVLRTTRISFRIPKTSSIVQIHKDGLDILARYVNSSEISVVDPSELNFWILLKCLMLRKFQMKEYFAQAIRAHRPRIVITFIDNDPTFYQLKSLNSSPVYIAVQNGLRHNYAYAYRSGFVDHLVKAGGKDLLSADLICTFGKGSSLFFESNMRTKTLVTGNLKNNSMELVIPDKVEFDIVFMSQHAPFDLASRNEIFYLNEASLSVHDFYKIESTVAKFLAQYCQEHSLRFAVSGKRGPNELFEREFFSKAIGELPYTFLPKIDSRSSYANAYNSKLVVVIDSTIGYELLSRGKKVAFFSARQFEPRQKPNNGRDTCFGYPNAYSDSGVFWTNFPDPNEYQRILNSLLGMTQEEWAAQIQPYTEHLTDYQPGNNVFIELLEKLGAPISSEVKRHA
jgi:surface carbohydrate biosynthesis protein